VITVR